MAQQTLDDGFAIGIFGPTATTANQTTAVTVQLVAPPEGRVLYGLVAFGYEHTAAGANYGAFPYGNYCPMSGKECKQFLTSSPAVNWTSPLVMLAPPAVQASYGAFMDKVIAPNPWLHFPDNTPFSRANDYDWQGACFVGDEELAHVDDIADSAAGGASKVSITCPMLLHQADASVAIWVAVRAATPEGPIKLCRYMPVALTAVASPVTVECPTSKQAPVVTSPKDGDHVGPNFDVVGAAQPNALVVICTDVIDVQTGEVVKSIPGNRHFPEPNGSFRLRIAAPRTAGEKRPSLYRVRVHSEGTDFTSPEAVVNVYPQADAKP